jgi:hypothetical protein
MLLLFRVRVRDGCGILFRVLDTTVKTATRTDEKDTANSPTWSFYGRARPKQKTSLSFLAPFSEISKKSISLAN